MTVHSFPVGSIQVSEGYHMSSLVSGGGGPHNPDMETRVAKLEAGMDSVRETLGRLEPMIARLALESAELKGKLPHLATKEDVATVGARVSHMEGKVSQIATYGQSIVLNAATVLTTILAVGALLSGLKAIHLI